MNAAVSVLAFAGTGIQALQSLRQLKDVDPEGHQAFVAIDDLKVEFAPTRHPIRWCRRRREMRQLLRESPQEARLYNRVRLQLIGWLLLASASFLAVIVALIE